MSQHADFAALSEQRPDCAHYCKGECDPFGATCWKHPKLHQIAEPDPTHDAGVMLDAEGTKALRLVIAVAFTALGCALLAWIFAGGAQ